MSVRRLERVILSSPRVLRSIISIETTQKSELIDRFTAQFVPMLRYNNPKLALSLASQGSSTETPTTGTDNDMMTLRFSDLSSQSINLGTVKQSHELIERILHIDTQKHILKDKYHNSC